MNCVKCFVSTEDQTALLTPVPQADFVPAKGAPNENTIVLDPSEKGQPILGFGANWTDTDVYNLLRMSLAEQDKVLEALFDPEKGAGWSFMRVPFGSTDWERNFSFYSYDDVPEKQKDWNLDHFSVQKDIDRGFFALLRRVKEKYPSVVLLASVWGLPGWMKDNDSLISGIFDPQYTEVYARYLRMAVQAWEEQGLELYAITTQNEPKSSNNRGTPATRFTWRMQKGVLLALRKEFDAYKIKTRIWCYDHNFDMANIFVDPMLADDEARAVIDGVAFHPYRGYPCVMDRFQKKYPDMPLYSTEKSIYDTAGMDELVQQLRYGTRSYINWSFFEDLYGGPHQMAGQPFVYTEPREPLKRTMIYNHPLHADQWGVSPGYGLFAQFSRYLKRGMRRIGCTYGHKKWVTATAFQEESTGEIALVVVNQTGTSQSFDLRCGSKVLAAGLPGKSVATWIFTPDGAMLDGSVTVDGAPEKVIYEMPVWDLEPVDLFFEEPAKAGTEIRWKVTVRNVGTAPTPERATVAIDILLDGDFRIARVYADVPVLQPGQDAVFAAYTPIFDTTGTKSTWTAKAGWHDVMALMTVGNCFAEENTLNNRYCKEFYFE